MTVTVIIPTYKPDGKFRKLLKELKNQTYPCLLYTSDAADE